ncbi:MAG TPA: AtpZ/AtpI family protein [Deltaproteobacteria bacterium]|nr:AtpZ/AtpI family protein [Deltaproteobacteria bacterium]HXK46103.1 AtpZ/AtpI family protein [Deltaproteobacteria bacterium]
MKRTRRNRLRTRTLNQIILLSAWSFTLVVSSFLFLFAGRWIDVRFNTEPTFMLGLFVLGIGLCFARMYTDYARARDELNNRRIRYQP